MLKNLFKSSFLILFLHFGFIQIVKAQLSTALPGDGNKKATVSKQRKKALPRATGLNKPERNIKDLQNNNDINDYFLTELPKNKIMNEENIKMLLAQQKAIELFDIVEKRGLINAGKTEKQLSDEIVQIAKEHFGTDTHWGKKIVRTGVNTLQPYSANPQNLVIQEGDILFLDFHPVFEGWEADLGRTYVLGNDPLKLKIKKILKLRGTKEMPGTLNKPNLPVLNFLNMQPTLQNVMATNLAMPLPGISSANIRTNNPMTPMICVLMYTRTIILTYFKQINMETKGIGFWSYIL